MSIQMFQTATFIDEEASMPPPRKVIRRGSRELEEALTNGKVELSLPKQDWRAWVSTAWNESSTDQVADSRSDVSNAFGDRASGPGEATGNEEGFACPQTPSPIVSRHKAAKEPRQSQRCHKDASTEQSSHSAVDQNSELATEPQSRLPRFSDIIGHAAVKLRLDEVLLPLALPPALADSILVGVRSLSTSILLFGPPGCGKTQLAKAIAGEAEAAFLSAGPSDILSKFVGESEAAIRSLFEKAYKQARRVESKCAVLFFDEIDALGQSRGGGSQGSKSGPSDAGSRRVLAELLIQLNKINSSRGRPDRGDTSVGCDEISACSSVEDHSDHEEDLHVTSNGKENVRIIVVAATNRPEDCDPALLRRFGVRVVVNTPSRRDRKKILKRFLGGIPHTISGEQLDALALETEGWSGSDLESLTREAAMAPVRECIRSAALMKRRNAQMGQEGGTSTSQATGDNFETARDGSHDKLLEQFSKLRPVHVQDFEDAIAFWTYNLGSVDPTCTSDAGDSGSFNVQTMHYDSSSDEED